MSFKEVKVFSSTRPTGRGSVSSPGPAAIFIRSRSVIKPMATAPPMERPKNKMRSSRIFVEAPPPPPPAEMEEGPGSAALSSSRRRFGRCITVTERDFRQFGDDISELRRRRLAAPAAQRRGEQELSPRSAFDLRCRVPAELRDPWADLPNPEEKREISELDRVLNEVWVPPDREDEEQEPQEEEQDRPRAVPDTTSSKQGASSTFRRRRSRSTNWSDLSTCADSSGSGGSSASSSSSSNSSSRASSAAGASRRRWRSSSKTSSASCSTLGAADARPGSASSSAAGRQGERPPAGGCTLPPLPGSGQRPLRRSATGVAAKG
mmetsp:Transcript_23035/g.57307  ORF Transcript_23035/g.57307 Transcript_23035/m.57307 type:complete len:321 (-) Transcript_23035:55-1017(-)